ncbi:hypothetical protein IO90_10990 [Chryseobacterium sp. FH1]|nr:hypothetical protein IO90_10990 [Chryseobacterium sp. FH1]
MDVEHWFAPMANNYGSSSSNYQAVYLSTKETTPFLVEIYSAGNLIGNETIAKGSPAVFKIPKQYIVTNEDSDRLSVLNKGLHLVGSKKFFANLRFSVTNHAEIVTSKGLGGLGELFYLGMPEVNLGSPTANSNHTASVIATENSTTVTLSGYDAGLGFTNDYAPSATKSVVLNKGESYIFEINNSRSQDFKRGLIGSKIESDKPISVSNGSFSGRIADTGIDIFMDQSIPVSKTGQEFIVMNGNGNLNSPTPSIMEKTLVIATKPNTNVFLNNNTTSTPDHTLANAGDFVFVDSNKYFPVVPTDNIFGLYVRTSENVYVYELLAGSSANEEASGGMNLIPALSCFLPSKIDELSAVDENEVSTNFGTFVKHDVKLNIIAQKGADVYVNDSKTGLLGPYPVLGTAEWELYSVLAVKDDITVESKNGSAITAGIAGGSTNVGFGGYFAGFSSVPAIAKVGDCAKGQELVVDDIYDLYEWTYSPDDTLGSYVPYPGSTYFISPGLKFGYYKCNVTKYSCLPARETNEFKYLKCAELTTSSPYTIGNCMSIPTIVPTFTKASAGSIDVSRTFISQHPAGGRAWVDKATGNVYFDAENTSLEKVTFKYYFESFGTFPDSEEVTVTVDIAQIKLTNISDVQCVNFDGKGMYNLKDIFEKPINQDVTYDKYEYFKDSALTQKIPVSDLEYYKSEPDKTVYVIVTNIYGCNNKSKPAQILLKTFELPTINTIDVEGQYSVTVTVSKGNPPYSYYLKKDGDLDYLPADSDYSTPTNSSSYTLPIKDGKGTYTLYVKSADDCNPVVQVFAVIEIPNVITPNNDGKNDNIDMSMLSYKLNPKFQIFDRNGKKLFEGNAVNHYIWDGKENGNPLSTGTYWYLLQWQDYEGAPPDTLTGWILLKNRNSD